jgi:hypothetical protein
MSTQTITTRPTLRRAAVAVLAVIFAAAVVRRIRVAAGVRRGDQAVIDAKRAIFTYTGALISHLAVGDRVSTPVGPLFFIVLTITSWALRPPSRRVSATS